MLEKLNPLTRFAFKMTLFKYKKNKGAFPTIIADKKAIKHQCYT